MPIGVFLVLFGEGLFLKSVSVQLFAIFAVILQIFSVPLSEERGLKRRFGESYWIYLVNVPRWIPRLIPWDPDLLGE
jgi:protein-S-isoprenylcysteine O-methyltransferase Ste14